MSSDKNVTVTMAFIMNPLLLDWCCITKQCSQLHKSGGTDTSLSFCLNDDAAHHNLSSIGSLFQVSSLTTQKARLLISHNMSMAYW